jgi:hypothetical protein
VTKRGFVYKRKSIYFCDMDKPAYPFNVNEYGQHFEFQSISKGRIIQKVVEFRELEISNIYNLALVDVKEDGTFDDMTVSNNQDMETIIATVIRIIQVFLIFKPTAKVLFMGSTASRTRLYRGIINKYLAEAEQIYEIHGIIDWENEPFQGHKTYDAFLIFPKIS